MFLKPEVTKGFRSARAPPLLASDSEFPRYIDVYDNLLDLAGGAAELAELKPRDRD